MLTTIKELDYNCRMTNRCIILGHSRLNNTTIQIGSRPGYMVQHPRSAS